jgi:predicted 2-oxoglutarate/Fe(II)-dependent dioxygenase YbiX
MDKFIEKILFNSSEIEFIKSKYQNLKFNRSLVTNQSDKRILLDYRKSFQTEIKLEGNLKNILLNKLKKIGIKELPNYGNILKYSTGDEFKRHIDNGYPHQYRYKTIIIQLSNENEYDGGELHIFLNNKKITANKSIGNTIIFDSSLEHSANIITQGFRYCLVMWLEKKHFGFDNTII